MQEREFKLDRLLKKALKYIWYFVALAIFASALSVGYVLLLKKTTYSASASVYVYFDYPSNYTFEQGENDWVNTQLLAVSQILNDNVTKNAIRDYLVSEGYDKNAIKNITFSHGVNGYNISARFVTEDITEGVCDKYVEIITSRLAELNANYSVRQLKMTVSSTPASIDGSMMSNIIKYWVMGFAASLIVYLGIIYLIYTFNPGLNASAELFEMFGINILADKGNYSAAAIRLKDSKKILAVHFNAGTADFANSLSGAFTEKEFSSAVILAEGKKADELKSELDSTKSEYVIVDTAPVTQNNEYLAVAKHCDGIVFAADIKTTKLATVKECLHDAEIAGIKILGVIYV